MENLYAPSQVGLKEPQVYANRDFKTTRKLYTCSRYLNAMGILFGIIGFFLLFSFIVSLTSSASVPTRFTLAGVTLFFIGFAWSMFKRPLWARWTSIPVGLILLLGFPLGTIFGGCILYSVFVGKPLWGKNRIKHKSIRWQMNNPYAPEAQ